MSDRIKHLKAWVRQVARYHSLSPKTHALGAQVESLNDDLEDLQNEFDQHQTKLSWDFEGDCWKAMRLLLTKAGFADWDEPDGVTADQAYEYLAESIATPAPQTVQEAWQPIETAPMDGTWVLGFRKLKTFQDQIEMWQYSAEHSCWVNAFDTTDFDESPTHWTRPLSPPSALSDTPSNPLTD